MIDETALLQQAGAGQELETAFDDLHSQVIAGLSKPRKELPCKLFYDETGSCLFDRICELPEYYPTRTELQIMRDHVNAMVKELPSKPIIVEYGSGSSVKTRLLLDRIPDAAAYLPIDISATHLKSAALSLAERYPDLRIFPICADYTQAFRLPAAILKNSTQVVAYFPGSTIGNFEPRDASAFLKSIRANCGLESSLLIGVDLKKNPTTLHEAYNDQEGVTAQFNLNLLRRLNRDLGSDFDLDAFEHYACFNPRLGRIEMHLVSLTEQTVKLGRGIEVGFAEGESIHTESCYKYTLDSFSQMAKEAGYRRAAAWTDPRRWFSVQYFVADD